MTHHPTGEDIARFDIPEWDEDDEGLVFKGIVSAVCLSVPLWLGIYALVRAVW